MTTSIIAAIYLRASGVDQIERDGLVRQREVCLRRAKEYGVRYSCVYSEEAVSGMTDHEDRPVLSQLLADLATTPELKLVFVEDARRLARDLIVSELAIQAFKRLGATVIAAEPNLDLTVADNDPTKKLIRQVLSAISEWDKSTTVQKLRVARVRKKREHGRCEGQLPFGRKLGEQETMARIVELRDSKTPYDEIAKILTAEQRPCRHKGRWTGSKLCQIYRRWSKQSGRQD